MENLPKGWKKEISCFWMEHFPEGWNIFKYDFVKINISAGLIFKDLNDMRTCQKKHIKP